MSEDCHLPWQPEEEPSDQISDADRRLAEFLAGYRALCEEHRVMVGMIHLNEKTVAYAPLAFSEEGAVCHLDQAILEMQLTGLWWIGAGDGGTCGDS